jgi:hypothetical protein
MREKFFEELLYERRTCGEVLKNQLSIMKQMDGWTSRGENQIS